MSHRTEFEFWDWVFDDGYSMHWIDRDLCIAVSPVYRTNAESLGYPLAMDQ